MAPQTVAVKAVATPLLIGGASLAPGASAIMWVGGRWGCPAVTSAIIGPRTMEQLNSQLPAGDIALDSAALDRIDEIVRPGVNLNPADTSYGEQVLQPGLRRR